MDDTELLELSPPEGTAEDRLEDLQRRSEGYFLAALMECAPAIAEEAIALVEASDFHSSFRAIYQMIAELIAAGSPYDLMAVAGRIHSGEQAARNSGLLADLAALPAEPLRLFEYGCAMVSAGFRAHLLAVADDDRDDAINGELAGVFERKQQRGSALDAHRVRVNEIRARVNAAPIGRLTTTRPTHLRAVGEATYDNAATGG